MIRNRLFIVAIFGLVVILRPGDAQDLTRPADRNFVQVQDRLARGGAWFLDPQVALIRGWYVTFLGREPDADGLQTNLRTLAQSGPELGLSSIIGSAEHFRIHNEDHREWVISLYRDLLHRRPAQREVRLWLNTIRESNGDLQRVALAFIDGVKNELGLR